MPKLILQPCGSADSVAHYKDTIEHDVHYDQIESFLSDIDKEKLKRIYPDGKLKIWGVTKGKNGDNRKKWNRIYVLFNPRGVSLSTVLSKFFMPVLIVVSKHSTFALSGFFAFNHDVTGSSLSSSCFCRACHYTGRWVDWISQPAIKNFIVTPLAQFFCPLKAVIQGCSHPTTLHRIRFLPVGAEYSK